MHLVLRKNAKALNNRVNAGTFPCAMHPTVTGLPAPKADFNGEATKRQPAQETAQSTPESSRWHVANYFTVTSVPIGISWKNLRATSPGRRMQP
jgi:hypothetical protein